MKRWISLLVALCLLTALFSGCGKKEEKEGGSNSSAASSSAATPAPVSSAPVRQTAKAVKVDAESGLNIRSSPSTDSEILGLAEDGSMLPLLVEKPSDGWYQVEYEGKNAYVSAEYAKVQEISLEEYNRLKQGGSASSSAPVSSAPTSSGDQDPQSPSGSQTSSQAPTPTPSPEPVGDDEDGE